VVPDQRSSCLEANVSEWFDPVCINYLSMDSATRGRTRAEYQKYLSNTRTRLLWVWVRNRVAVAVALPLFFTAASAGFLVFAAPGKGMGLILRYAFGVAVFLLVLWAFSTNPQLNQLAERWHREETELKNLREMHVDTLRAFDSHDAQPKKE